MSPRVDSRTAPTRAVEAARAHGMWVVWVYWSNRPDLRNLGAPTLYAFKHRPDQTGVGEPLGAGRVLTAGTWNAEMVDELRPLMREEDVRVEKVRTNGFVGTHLDQVLRTQGIGTRYFAGVNVDQCVATTMEEACFRQYNCVLLEDAGATSSPDSWDRSGRGRSAGARRPEPVVSSDEHWGGVGRRPTWRSGRQAG